MSFNWHVFLKLAHLLIVLIFILYLQTVGLTATAKDDSISDTISINDSENTLTPEAQVIIIHIPSDYLAACWVKHRLEKFGQQIKAYTLAELLAEYSDIELLNDFIIQRCEQGAICLFYVSLECEEDVFYNSIRQRVLMYRIHRNNHCVAPVWDSPEVKKTDPYGLVCFTGVQVQSPRLVQNISVMLKKRRGMHHAVKK